MAPLDKAWLRGLLVALGLLILPIVAWFVIPARPSPSGETSAQAPFAPPGGFDLPGDERPSRRKISGHVIGENGEPIVGALVALTKGQLKVGTKTSDSAGAFSFSAGEGDHALRATVAGFGESNALVTASGDVTDLELKLVKVLPLSGQVVDGEGKAVVSAHVACAGDHGQGGTSDDAGNFTLPADAAGCKATASHPDHGTSAPVTLRAGTQNVITMASPGKISGTVVDERGAGLAAAIVAVESFVPVSGEGGPFFKQNKADETGAFELSDLAPGRYVLAASALGKPPVKTAPIELGSGESSRGLTITLAGGATLTGVVTDRATGSGIAGVTVALDAATSSGKPATGSAVTDAAGRYSLKGVPKAPCSVRFRHDEYTPRIVSIDGSDASKLTQDVDLAKRGTGGDFELTGIGATLVQGAKFVEVGSVLDNGPAKAAGLLSGDRIESIDGRSAASFSVSDCVQRLRGQAGTRVSLGLGRGTKALEITITRAHIGK